MVSCFLRTGFLLSLLVMAGLGLAELGKLGGLLRLLLGEVVGRL